MGIQRKQHTRATASKKIDAESANARDKKNKEIVQRQKQNKRKQKANRRKRMFQEVQRERHFKVNEGRKKKKKKEEQRNVYRAASIGNNSGGDWCAIM